MCEKTFEFEESVTAHGEAVQNDTKRSAIQCKIKISFAPFIVSSLSNPNHAEFFLKTIAIVAILAAVGGISYGPAVKYWRERTKPKWETAKVVRGDAVRMVNSTGTVRPVLSESAWPWARGNDIMRQFLVELIVLSCIGGFIGIVLGTSASVGATMFINSISVGSDWPIVISLPAAGISMVFAAAVGIFFGYYPARRASQLDPIDALRYE